MAEKEKAEIDDMPYVKMLRLNRFSPIGDPMFQGEKGEYFLKVMNEKKAELTSQGAANISKEIGWG